MKLSEIRNRDGSDPFADGYPDHFYPERPTVEVKQSDNKEDYDHLVVIDSVANDSDVDEAIDMALDSITGETDWEVQTDDSNVKGKRKIYTLQLKGKDSPEKYKKAFTAEFTKASEFIASRNADKALRNR